ncbi:ribonuclease H-like domain-containing protein [Tanacetum coccineum]
MTAKLQKASKTLNPTFSSTPIANQHETQPDPSPRPLPTIPIPDSIPEGFWWESWNQANEIKHLKAQIKKLKKKAKLVITHHKAWMTNWRKPAKSEPTVHKDPAFDDLDDVDVNDAMDYMETDAYIQKGVSTEDQVSTVKPDEGTDKPEVSTAKPKEVEVSTDKLDEGTAELKDGTSNESTAPTTVFRDDETIAEFLVSISQTKVKQKGVMIKDAEDSDRPRATSTRLVLTLKPLPKINPKDKGKKVLEEEAESEGVYEAERSIDLLLKDEEITRKVQEDWEAEEEMKKLSEEEIEKSAKFLYDTIAAQRRFLAQQRAAAIRSRPPTRTQLRNQIMTYLKHVGGKKHTDLKNKNFEEIQVLYKKVKRSDKDFIAIGSAEDERQIKEMNEESKDPKKKRVVNETPREEDTAKVPAEQEVTEQGTKKRKCGHVKMIARKRPRPQPDDDSDNEHRKCLRIVTHLIVTIVRKINGDQNLLAFNNLMEGDLKIMMESSIEENDQGDFWNNQQDWEIFRWRLMLDLGLEVKEESTAALHLISDGGFVALEEVLKRLNYRKKVKYNKEIRTLKIVLLTETECLVLSLDFKLLDESQVLLKIPRQNNMYSFDLKNVVPSGDLTDLRESNTKPPVRPRLFSWVFFLATKDKTPEILKNFITGIKNQTYQKVKTIRCDNGTEFKNRIMNEFYEMKGIRREFSIARTPQQNGRKPALSFMRPFGCPVTILNTLDHLGKFDGKSDDGFFVGYSINSKAFRVFNTRTRFVEENLHINFLENKPNVAGTGPNWMFDIDTLTMSMNYQPVFAGNQTNGNAGTKANIDAAQAYF